MVAAQREYMKFKELFTTKRLCRAGVIAALYVALTYAFGAIAYSGFLEIRPAEALTVLPLFFPEAVPALWIGCMLANLGSPFIMYDVPIGGDPHCGVVDLYYRAFDKKSRAEDGFGRNFPRIGKCLSRARNNCIFVPGRFSGI